MPKNIQSQHSKSTIKQNLTCIFLSVRVNLKETFQSEIPCICIFETSSMIDDFTNTFFMFFLTFLQKFFHFFLKKKIINIFQIFLKVSFFQKDFLVSLDSPKKRTNEFVFSTQTAFCDAKPR